MPTITTTVTSAAATGVVTTQTTTEATPEPPAPAPAPAVAAAAEPSYDPKVGVAPAFQHVDDGWAPNSTAVPEDPVGALGGGKAAILVKRPVGDITQDCLEIRDRPIPELTEGQCLIQNVLISLDPTHRIWMSDIPQYMPSVGLNTVMRAGGVGKVVKSTDEAALPVGTFVFSFSGVQEYTICGVAEATPVVPDVPLSWNLSLFSMVIGHTAWVGYKIMDVKPGDTVVISGAAGAVGSIAGQLAKRAGARVVGIAGTPAKIKWLKEELGFDGAVNYKTEDVAAGLARECPKGIDCFFDNVGGGILNTVFGLCNTFARVAFCGAISQYNAEGSWDGPSNYNMILMRRIKVQGFICVDHASSIGDSMAEIGEAVKEGKMKWNEDIREVPIDEYVDSVNLLYTGGNTGKLMMKIADY